MERMYVVKRVAEVDWEQVPAVELEHTGWLESCAVAAKAQACHDGENLWIRMEAKESPIRATLTGKLDAICTDSCLEFFFAPDPELPHYFNFEFNPLAALYLGFGAERATRVRQIVRDVNVSFAPKPFFTEDGWGIEYKIPRSFLRVYDPDFEFSGKKYGNFYKCGDNLPNPHFLSWNKIDFPRPNFHLPEFFGEVVFE